MLGIGQNFHSIVECFENFVKEIKLKIGGEYKLGTLKNYNVTLGHFKEFISKQYYVKDINFKDLNYKFITEFELMCKTKWECKRNSTATKHIQRIRKVIGIETVSAMLGHASLITTQIYAKVIENKFSADMLQLRGKLNPRLEIVKDEKTISSN